MLLEIGSIAPDFSAIDQHGEIHKLSDYKNKWLIIYFYPRDNTPGCTKEACNIRDNYHELLKYSHIIGISTDPVVSHQKFANKFSLPFPLLSDQDKTIVRSYKVWSKKKFTGKEFMGTHRVTYIINNKTKIAKVYPKIKPATHAEELIQDIKKLI